MGEQVDCMADGTYDTGDTAWMLTSTALVFIQIPGLGITQRYERKKKEQQQQMKMLTVYIVV
jgi:ammonia channel protein AmtB